MKTNTKYIIILILLAIVYAFISTSETMKVSEAKLQLLEQEVYAEDYAENIDYCTSVYWGNENTLNIDCDMEKVQSYINNK